jgi:hypothetical protein
MVATLRFLPMIVLVPVYYVAKSSPELGTEFLGKTGPFVYFLYRASLRGLYIIRRYTVSEDSPEKRLERKLDSWQSVVAKLNVCV